MPRLFLFDIDGTLIDGGGAGRASLGRAITETLGDGAGLGAVTLAGNTDAQIVLEVLEHTGHAAEIGDARFAEVKRRYLAHLPDCVAGAEAKRVLPGVRPLLDWLGMRGHPVGLATGNFRDGARMKLEWCGLWSFFPIGGFGDTRAHRADLVRDAIDEAAAHWSCTFRPRDILIIGDTPKDVAAGKALGTRTLAVATGIHSVEELAATGPDILLPSLADLARTKRALEI